MNFKTIAISSLLIGTAACAATEPTKQAEPKVRYDDLINAINKSYKDDKGVPTLSFAKRSNEEYNAIEARFDYEHFINHAGPVSETNPKEKAAVEFAFCSWSPEGLEGKTSAETKEIIDKHEKVLQEFRDKIVSAENLKAFNEVFKKKLDYIMTQLHAIIDLNKIHDLNTEDDVTVYINDELRAFEIALSTYEEKPNNFKEIRSNMESLHGIVRFDSKAIEALDQIVAYLSAEEFTKKLEDLRKNLAAYDVAVKALEDISKTKPAADDKEAQKKHKDAFKAVVDAKGKVAKSSIITMALKKAHDKTSSPETMGVFVGIGLALGAALLIFKHMQLLKKEKEESFE